NGPCDPPRVLRLPHPTKPAARRQAEDSFLAQAPAGNGGQCPPPAGARTPAGAGRTARRHAGSERRKTSWSPTPSIDPPAPSAGRRPGPGRRGPSRAPSRGLRAAEDLLEPGVVHRPPGVVGLGRRDIEPGDAFELARLVLADEDHLRVLLAAAVRAGADAA